MEYSPVACMRQSSRCCLSESLGCLPRNFPLVRAMSIPSRVRKRMRSASNSAKVARAGSGAGGAGEAVIGVDAILGHAKLPEPLALGRQILPVGGTGRVSDEDCRHGGSVRIGSRFRNCFRTIHMRRSWLRFGGGRRDRLCRPLDDPLTDNAAPAGMNG